FPTEPYSRNQRSEARKRLRCGVGAPRSDTREPARHVGAEALIVVSKGLAQCRFFVERHEEVTCSGPRVRTTLSTSTRCALVLPMPRVPRRCAAPAAATSCQGPGRRHITSCPPPTNPDRPGAPLAFHGIQPSSSSCGSQHWCSRNPLPSR